MSDFPPAPNVCPGRDLRVAITWSRMPVYAGACLNRLSSVLQTPPWTASIGDPWPYMSEGEVACYPSPTVLPFDGPHKESVAQVIGQMQDFNPTVFLGNGWHPVSRQVARHLRRQGVLTVCMSDNPWRGTLRQIVRCLAGRRVLHMSYDVLWVPGARALPLAQLAGYESPYVWQGQYSADTERLAAEAAERLRRAESSRDWPHQFLFAGRLVEVKNIAGLAAGYVRYRAVTDDPWPLVCIGDGPERPRLERIEGIRCLGWQTPSKTLEMLGRTGCFVLPSSFDAWPLVIHEATSSGLPVVASWVAGSTAELVRDGYNGRVFGPSDPGSMALAMKWVSSHPEPWVLGARSLELSRQFSPTRWAEYLVERTTELLALRDS